MPSVTDRIVERFCEGGADQEGEVCVFTPSFSVAVIEVLAFNSPNSSFNVFIELLF